MKFSTTIIVVALASIASALPTALDLEDRDPHYSFHESPKVFAAITMKSTCGKCLAADASAGNNGANAVQLKACDSSAAQQWDVITKGKTLPKDAVIVNSMTKECLSFDPSRGAGKEVMLVSCAAGKKGVFPQGKQQQFPLKGQSLTLEPVNADGTCVTVKDESTLSQAPCSDADNNQLFTMG